VENWAHTVATKWKTEGVKTNEPATSEMISQVEDALDFTFPDDFKELYLEIDGFRGLDWQKHLFTIWPLKMIVTEFNDSNDKDFIGFSDFLLASHCIGFRKSQNGIFKIYGLVSDNESITTTFKETIEMINSNHKLIY
jgi:hypothetical protein